MKHTGKEAPLYRFAMDPVFVVSFCVMLLNDHFFRPSGVMPAVAGKISDFAIMLFLPAAGALASVYARYLKYRFTRRGISDDSGTPRVSPFDAVLGVGVSAAVFIPIKSSAAFNVMYTGFINSINVLFPVFPRLTSTGDIGDLFALPALAVSYLVMRKYFYTTDRAAEK